MILKCKMCGGTLNITEGSTVCECEYCGTSQTVPVVKDDVTINLFNRANNLRLKNEFDKAEAIYEKIVQEDDSNAEAHWGIVLCKYGIEYVDDPLTKKKIPTCHRTLYNAITADADYQAAVDYSDTLQQSIYESEARAIDKIQKDILSIVKNEKPFDVFICYKETDDDGKRTIDSVIANDIYYQLTQEGFKVFYAAITLEDKLGQEYEPYIFAALNSAKVMLSIGTKPEYFTSVWVKNEWSRFLSLMKTDRTKLLIPCYRDMDAYDLPEEFSHLQAQDMSKIGFINDVVRGIKKVIKKDEPKPDKETILQTQMSLNMQSSFSTSINTSVLIKRAYISLEDGDFDKASEYADQILNQDPENGEAYFVLYLASFGFSSANEFKKYFIEEEASIDNNINRAIKYSSKIAEFIKECEKEKEYFIKEKRNEETYNRGFLLSDSNDIDDLNEAISLFESILEYKDSKELIERCRFTINNIEEGRKQKLYDSANELSKSSKIEDIEKSLSLFNQISDFMDSAMKIEQCQETLSRYEDDLKIAKKENIYNNAIYVVEHELYSKLDKTIENLESIMDYKDTKELMYRCKQLKKGKINKKNIKDIIIIAVLVLLFILTVIIGRVYFDDLPERKTGGCYTFHNSTSCEN